MSKFTCMRITIKGTIHTPDGQEDIQTTLDMRVESAMYLVSTFINVLESKFRRTEQRVSGLPKGIAVDIWKADHAAHLLTARLEEVFVLTGIVTSPFDGMRPTKHGEFWATIEKAIDAFLVMKAERIAASRRESVDA